MYSSIISFVGAIAMLLGFAINPSPPEFSGVDCQATLNVDTGKAECAGSCPTGLPCGPKNLKTYEVGTMVFAFCNCDTEDDNPPGCCHSEYQVIGKGDL